MTSKSRTMTEQQATDSDVPTADTGCDVSYEGAHSDEVETVTLTHEWPTCRVEGCDVPAHRIILVYEAAEYPEYGEVPTFVRGEGLCLIHDARRE